MPMKPREPLPVLAGEDYEDLRRFACKRVGAADAADLVQETYLRFLQHADRDAIREPRAFLFRIAANLGIDRWRQARLREQWAAADVDFEAVECHRPGPEAGADGALQLEALLAALEEVPEVPRHAFVLNKFEGLSQADIARRLDLPEKTVQRHIARVIAHCAARLGYGDDA